MANSNGRGAGVQARDGNMRAAEEASSVKTRKRGDVRCVQATVSLPTWLEPESMLGFRVGTRTEARVGRP